MEKTFIPGDIVKAKLVRIYLIVYKVSFGDSSKLFLSTSGDEYGVIFAKNQDTCKFHLMIYGLKLFST